MESRTIGALDDNADDKVQIDELTGTLASMKARFTDLDINKDGGLDAKELAVGNVSRASSRDLRDADIDL